MQIAACVTCYGRAFPAVVPQAIVEAEGRMLSRQDIISARRSLLFLYS